MNTSTHHACMSPYTHSICVPQVLAKSAAFSAYLYRTNPMVIMANDNVNLATGDRSLPLGEAW